MRGFATQASEVFGELGVQVVTSRRLLGGVVGDEDGRAGFVSYLVEKWVNKLDILTTIANQQPKVAYAAVVKSLQWEWNFAQCVIPQHEKPFSELEQTVAKKVLPAIF